MSSASRNIVVGIASLDEADPLIELGRRAADALGATLHLVHAFTLPEPMLQPFAELEWLNPEQAELYREGLVGRLRRMAHDVVPEARLRCHALPGPAAAVLTSVVESVGAELVVVGATRRGTLSRTILGTSAQRVLRASRVPTLVVREPLDDVHRVLLTTDLSPLSTAVHERGVDLVLRLCGERQPEIRSLLVVGYDVAAPPPLRTELVHAAADAEMKEFLAGCRAPCPVTPHVRIGEPSSEIVAYAAEWPADLLVLGTHGRTGAQRFLLGSVAEATVRSALCSVLVIPAAVVGATEPVGSAGRP